MNLSITAKYDPKKHDLITNSVKDMYRYAPDPKGFEAKYTMAEAISTAFPGVDTRAAFAHGPRIMEAMTGYKLEPESFLKEFGKTFASSAASVLTSMKMSSAMMILDPVSKRERLDKIAAQSAEKLPYRSDFKNFNLFTDLVVSSANMLPSMLPFFALHAISIPVGLMAGPVAADVTARTLGSVVGGLMEAGGLVRELYSLEDIDGNKLPLELIEGAWALTMAGTGLINYFTQGFEQQVGKVIANIFSGGKLAQQVTSGVVRQWGLKHLKEWGKNIAVESIQEALQELVGMLATNNAIRIANRDHGTKFEKHEVDEILNVMARTAAETAKGMVLVGGFSQGLTAFMEYNSSSFKSAKSAQKFSPSTDTSQTVSLKNIAVRSDAKYDPAFTKFEAPLKVQKAGDLFVPVDSADSSRILSASRKGATDLNVDIVGNIDFKGEVDTALSILQAHSLASKIDGAQVLENNIVLQTDKDKVIYSRVLADNSDVISYIHNNDGSISVQLNNDGIGTEIKFTTADKVTDAKAPIMNEVQRDSTVRAEAKELTPESMKRDIKAFESDLKIKGATDADIIYLKETVMPQMVDAIKQRKPRMSTVDAYGIAIPSTYYAYLVSEVVGMTPQAFFDTHFNVEAFINLDVKQEEAFLKSAKGQAAIDTHSELQGVSSPADTVVLGGLLQEVDGKWQIALGRGFNPITLIHELSHPMLDMIKDTDAFAPFLKLYSKELEADGGVVGSRVHERFVRDIELYFSEGKTPDVSVRRIFARIAEAMKAFVHRFMGQTLDQDVKVEIEKLFNINTDVDTNLDTSIDLSLDKVTDTNLGVSDVLIAETTIDKEVQVKDTQDKVKPKEAVQLDLFADEETFTKSVVELSDKTLASIESKYFTMQDLLENHYLLLRGREPFIFPSKEGYALLPKLFWMRLLENADASRIDIPSGDIFAAKGLIEHVKSKHSTPGFDFITDADILKMVETIIDPVAIVKSPSTDKVNAGSILFVTDSKASTAYGEKVIVFPLRKGEITEGKTVTEYSFIPSLYPWKEADGALPLNRYIYTDNLLAINVDKASELGINERGLTFDDFQSLQRRMKDSDRARNLVDLGTKKMLDEAAETKARFIPEKKPHASIETRLSLDNTKEMLARGEYPHDADLDIHAGDPDIDWEIQFRKISMQDKQLMDITRDIVNTVDTTLDIDAQNKQIVDTLNEMTSEDFFIDIDEESGNTSRFINRLREYFSFQTTEDADKAFIKSLQSDSEVIKVSKALAEGASLVTDTDISPYIYRLAMQEAPTDYAVRMARQALRADRTNYRQMYLEKIGDTRQLSFERNTEHQVYSGEVSRYQSSDVAKLLASDIDPNVKALIRNGVATENTLQYIIDKATKDIEAYAEELGIKSSQLEALIKLNEQASADYVAQSAELKKIRELNKKNRDRYHGIKRTLKMRTDALEAKVEMQKLLRRGDQIANASANYDAKKMHTLSSFWNIMKTNDGGVKKPLDHHFVRYNLDFDTLPLQFKQFFEMRDDGIYFSTKMNRMSLVDLHYLEALMVDYKEKAKGRLQEMRNIKTEAVGDTVTRFISGNMGIDIDTMNSASDIVRDTIKEEGSRRSKPTNIKEYVDTQFLTLSRLLKKDESGALYDYFFNEKTGLDVIEGNKYREISRRYADLSSFMKDNGITEKELRGKYITLERTGRYGDLDISVLNAIAMYIYDQQDKGRDILTSLDGNAFTEVELDTIIKSLPSQYKAFGDFLIADMTARYGPTAEVFYRVENESLGKVDKYFTFVPRDSRTPYLDILRGDNNARTAKPSDTHTEARTQAIYPLSLDLISNWMRMVEKQEHYIASAEWIKNTQFMLDRNGGDLARAIEQSMGKPYTKAIESFLKDFANRMSVYDDTDNIINNVRNNLAVARIGANFVPILSQIPSLAFFASEFGPGRLLGAMSDVIFNYGETNEFIKKMAPKMEFRSAYPEVQLMAESETRTGYQRAIRKVGRVATAPIRMVDRLVVNTLWIGYYKDAMAKGVDSDTAALRATRFIGDTQIGGSIVDVAPIYRSNQNLVKFLTMFTGQQNKNFNAIWADLPSAFKQREYKKAFGVAASLGLSFTGILLAKGHIFSKEDEKEREWYWKVLQNVAGQTLSQTPIIGNALGSIVMGEYYDSDSFPIIPGLARVSKAIVSGDTEKISKSLLGLGIDITEITGLPSGALRKTTKFVREITDEDFVNFGHLLNTRWADLFNEW